MLDCKVASSSDKERGTRRKKARSGRLSSRGFYEKLTHFRDSEESKHQLKIILDKARPELSEGAGALLGPVQERKTFLREAQQCGSAFYSDRSLESAKAEEAYLMYRRAWEGAKLKFAVTGRLQIGDEEAEERNDPSLLIPSDELYPAIDSAMQKNLLVMNDNYASKRDVSIFCYPYKDWTLLINDAWLLGLIHAKAEMHIASPLRWDNFWLAHENRMSMMARELIGLTASGYELTRPSQKLEVVAVCVDLEKAKKATLLTLKAEVEKYQTPEILKQFFQSLPDSIKGNELSPQQSAELLDRIMPIAALAKERKKALAENRAAAEVAIELVAATRLREAQSQLKQQIDKINEHIDGFKKYMIYHKNALEYALTDERIKKQVIDDILKKAVSCYDRAKSHLNADKQDVNELLRDHESLQSINQRLGMIYERLLDKLTSVGSSTEKVEDLGTDLQALFGMDREAVGNIEQKMKKEVNGLKHEEGKNNYICKKFANINNKPLYMILPVKGKNSAKDMIKKTYRILEKTINKASFNAEHARPILPMAIDCR